MPYRIVAAAVLFLLIPISTCAAQPLREIIDQQIEAAWNEEGIEPAADATDAEFLRRVYLDLHGVIPTYEQAVEFLTDDSPGKREKLIARLLGEERYAVHQADVWDLIYFTRNPPGYGTDKRDGFQEWLRGQFRQNTPYDQWVRQMLKAEGNTVEDGAPMFYVMYNRKPEDATEAITQKFLGVQLQCARCHDHPYEDWTQEDFYGVAAFFTRLQSVNLGDKNGEKAYAIGEMNRGEVLFTGPVTEAEAGQKGKPVAAKFLGGDPLEEPELGEDVEDPRNFPNGKMPPEPVFSRKDAFAEWATSKENPYFARAAVNRVWGQFMGKGIIDPVDNITGFNDPSHPALLDALEQEFKAHDFDLKYLTGEILNSRAYQLSSAGPAEELKPLWYEQARFRPLSAEELFESWLLATGMDQTEAKDRKPEDRFRVRGFTWDYMRRFFGRPNDGQGNFQGGLAEHLYLNNGQVHQLITEQEGGLHHWLINASEPWETRVERLFLQTLSRYPTPEERAHFAAFCSADDDQRTRVKEAIWTLVSCSEFRFNH